MFRITKGTGKDRFETVTRSAIEAENLKARGYTVEKIEKTEKSAGEKPAVKK